MTRASARVCSRVLVALLAAHVLWGIARVPGKVYGKRLREIASYQDAGPVGFFLDSHVAKGADAVAWLLENSPSDGVVAWRGETKGAFELASGLLAPRLLVPAAMLPAGVTEYHGRPLADRILVGHGDRVELVVR